MSLRKAISSEPVDVLSFSLSEFLQIHHSSGLDGSEIEGANKVSAVGAVRFIPPNEPASLIWSWRSLPQGVQPPHIEDPSGFSATRPYFEGSSVDWTTSALSVDVGSIITVFLVSIILCFNFVRGFNWGYFHQALIIRFHWWTDRLSIGQPKPYCLVSLHQ